MRAEHLLRSSDKLAFPQARPARTGVRHQMKACAERRRIEIKAAAEGDVGVTTKDLNEDTNAFGSLHQDCMTKAEIKAAAEGDLGVTTKDLNEDTNALGSLHQDASLQDCMTQDEGEGQGEDREDQDCMTKAEDFKAHRQEVRWLLRPDRKQERRIFLRAVRLKALEISLKTTLSRFVHVR